MVNFIELKDLCFSYKKDKFVLNKLSTKIFGGKITALLGVNGSGKTTLFRILVGILKQTSGSILYNNTLIDENNISFYKKDLGFMPEILQFYKDMSVKEVLVFLANLKGVESVDFDDILNRVFLFEHANKKVKDLSKGMKQRLNLAQSILGYPKVVLFDEPSNGFDCGSINMFYSILRQLANTGSIVLLSSHHLTEVYGNVDCVLFLSNGSIVHFFDLNAINLDAFSFNKDVFVVIDGVIDTSFFQILKEKFSNIKLKNYNILYGRVNNIMIIDLILFILSFKLSIIDIRIDNKILEDILVSLS